MSNITSLRAMARCILGNAASYEWSLQGMGLLRLYLPDNHRLHVWDSRYRRPGVSMIHDHLQWGLESTIIAGSMMNIRYEIRPDGRPYMLGLIKPGYGTYFKDAPAQVSLRRISQETYGPGATYAQEPADIHETNAVDGTVTLMRKLPTDNESARVFWPAGTEWGTAEPREATDAEVRDITSYALRTWFEAAA
jgi:hypothetical protein